MRESTIYDVSVSTHCIGIFSAKDREKQKIFLYYYYLLVNNNKDKTSVSLFLDPLRKNA